MLNDDEEVIKDSGEHPPKPENVSGRIRLSIKRMAQETNSIPNNIIGEQSARGKRRDTGQITKS